MKFSITAILLVILSGCIVEPTSYSYAYIENMSDIGIEFIPYVAGDTLINGALVLMEDQEAEVSEDNYIGRGKQKNPGFSSKKFSDMDSLVVVFNGIDRIVHYRKRSLPATLSEKHYLPEDDRCFFNLDNWHHEYTEPSKSVSENYYRFTFTKQDHIDAKD